jgi:hypothetical protein
MTHDRGTVAPTIAAVLMAVMGTLLSSVVYQLRNICDVEPYDDGVADETYVTPGSPRSGWAITTPLIATLTGGLTPTLTVIVAVTVGDVPVTLRNQSRDDAQYISATSVVPAGGARTMTHTSHSGPASNRPHCSTQSQSSGTTRPLLQWDSQYRDTMHDCL